MKNYIKNFPDYANNYNFWVVRMVEDEFWFYGAYPTWEKADKVATEINGLVVMKVMR